MLVTLSELKKFLNVTDTDEDPVLYDCLVRAQSEAESYCNRQFELAMRTEYYRANKTTTLQLNAYPLVDSGVYSLVMYDDMDLEWGADTLLAATEYQVDAAFGTVTLTGQYFQTALNPALKNIKVIYGGGYDASTLPNDLRGAIMKLAGADYKKANTYLNAVAQSTESEQDSGDLRGEAHNILDLYKRWR